jgi:ABC-type uncharacterized transport system substrate-binding protein
MERASRIFFAVRLPMWIAILRGANAGELPVQLPTKYQLVVNLKTAKTLGLTIPEFRF